MSDLSLPSPGDDLMSEADFALLAQLLHKLTGIDLKPSKRSMASVRISRLLKAQGARDIRSYLSRLQSNATEPERENFIEALTTNVTRFDRESHQFDHLTKSVLPELSERLRRGGRVRLWSAGCSSGEEAFDLAFRVLEVCPEAATLDCRILATDIDRKVLKKASTAIYAEADVNALRQTYRNQHFFKNQPSGSDRLARGETFSVQGPARDIVTFRRLNLLSDWPFSGEFDVIMCRNVTIYFDTETQSKLWQRFTDRLRPNGALYVGHSETVPVSIAKNYLPEGSSIFRKQAISAAANSTSLPRASLSHVEKQ